MSQRIVPPLIFNLSFSSTECCRLHAIERKKQKKAEDLEARSQEIRNNNNNNNNNNYNNNNNNNDDQEQAGDAADRGQGQEEAGQA